MQVELPIPAEVIRFN